MKKLLNPFVWYSGEKTLAAGAVGLLASVLVARWGGATFRGVVSSGYGALSAGQLLGQAVAGWLVLSALLYGAARIFSKSRVRVVDLFGNQLFARLALLPLTCLGALPCIRRATERLAAVAPEQIVSIAPEMLPMLAFGLVSLALLVAFFAWSWLGFSVAANLRGGKAAGIYVVCYLLAEVLAGCCTSAIAGW